MLFVEVPAYRDASVCHAVKVNFCVINGKRKRSQPQHFTFTPLAGRKPQHPLSDLTLRCFATHLRKRHTQALGTRGNTSFTGGTC